MWQTTPLPGVRQQERKSSIRTMSEYSEAVWGGMGLKRAGEKGRRRRRGRGRSVGEE